MARSPAEGSPAGPGLGHMLFPLAVVFFVFYFLIIRPQRKKDDTHKKFLEGLKKGDEVITQSGIHGRIAGVADRVITLQVDEKTKIKVTKSSVTGYQPTAPEAK